jgi:hypothetical protein
MTLVYAVAVEQHFHPHAIPRNRALNDLVIKHTGESLIRQNEYDPTIQH